MDPSNYLGPIRNYILTSFFSRARRWSNEYPNVHFVKIDVDDNPELAAEHNVKAMPTFHIFKDGNAKAADEFVSAAPPKIQALIEKHNPAGEAAPEEEKKEE